MAASPEHTLSCSFCRKSEDQISRLVAGVGVYICNECVAVARKIMSGKPEVDFADLTGVEDDEALRRLSAANEAVRSAEAAVADMVARLRERAISWARIGDALGVSRQAAWDRFAPADA